MWLGGQQLLAAASGSSSRAMSRRTVMAATVWARCETLVLHDAWPTLRRRCASGLAIAPRLAPAPLAHRGHLSVAGAQLHHWNCNTHGFSHGDVGPRRRWMSSSAGKVGDPYQVLGVPRNASVDDIKKAYRKLALKWHPDRNRDNQREAEAEFKKVSKAYSILSDQEQRARFDRFGADLFDAMEKGGRPTRHGKAMTEEEEAAEIFKAVFGDKPLHEIIREVEQAFDQQRAEFAAREEQLASTSQQLRNEATELTLRASREQDTRRRDQLLRLAMERKAQADQADHSLAMLRIQHLDTSSKARFAVSQMRMLDPRHRAIVKGQNRIRMGLSLGTAAGAYFIFGYSFFTSVLVYFATSLVTRSAFAVIMRAGQLHEEQQARAQEQNKTQKK